MRILFIFLMAANCGRIGFESRDDAMPGATDGSNGPSLDGSAGPSTDGGAGPFIDGSANGANLVPDGLIYYYAFEGGLLDDETGAHPGTCTNCPTAVQGYLGGGAAFDGSQCIFIADASDLQPSTFSLAAWANSSVSSEDGVISGRPFLGAAGTQNSREIFAGIGSWFASSGGTAAVGNTVMNPYEWHHIAATFDGTILRLYIDGSTTGGGLLFGAVQYSIEQDSIGCDTQVGVIVRQFIGIVDELRLYDRALTAAEVAELAAI